MCGAGYQRQLVASREMPAPFIDRAVAIQEDRFLQPIAAGAFNYPGAQLSDRAIEPCGSTDVLYVLETDIALQSRAAPEHRREQIARHVCRLGLRAPKRDRLALDDVEPSVDEIHQMAISVVRWAVECRDPAVLVDLGQIGIGGVIIGMQEQRPIDPRRFVRHPEAIEIDIKECIAIDDKKPRRKMIERAEQRTGGAAGLAIVQQGETQVGKSKFGTVGFDLVGPMIDQKQYFRKAGAQGGDLPT